MGQRPYLRLINLLLALAIPLIAQQQVGTTKLTVGGLVISQIGNHFVNGAGATIRTLGINVPEPCPPNTAAPLTQATVNALSTWHPNAVRVGLDETAWLGINGCTSYQTSMIAFIGMIEAAGMYPILDLHYTGPGSSASQFDNPLPNAHSTTFWNSVATQYKNDTAVLFEIFNEPNAVTWACWQTSGCMVTTNTGGVSYTGVGMQSLVNTIRSAGATTQPIIIDCVGFAQDCSQWTSTPITDSSNHLSAAFHDYDWVGCDPSCLSVNANPILSQSQGFILTEIGEGDCANGFINSFMNWADTNNPKLGYVGWGWFVGGGCGSTASFQSWLITDYSGTATQPGPGAGYQAHLAVTSP